MSSWTIGTVVRNDDDSKRCRLRVRAPEVAPGELPDWIEHDAPHGLGVTWVPEVGEPVVLRRLPSGRYRWTASPLDGRSVRSQFQSGYPGRSGIASPDGKAATVLKSGGGVLVLAGAGGIQLSLSESSICYKAVQGEPLQAWTDALVVVLGGLASGLSGVPITAAVGSALTTALSGLPAASTWQSTVVTLE